MEPLFRIAPHKLATTKTAARALKEVVERSGGGADRNERALRRRASGLPNRLPFDFWRNLHRSLSKNAPVGLGSD